VKSRVHAKRGPTRIGDSIDAHVRRVYIAKFGPLGTILLTLVVGILSAVLMVLLFGALLVALPAVVLLVTAAIIAGLLRVYFQRSP
jgi:membrane associated rhomboid family serine protease